MPDWGWLSRGALLGIFGTAALTALLSLDRPQTNQENNSQASNTFKAALAPTLPALPPKRQAVPVSATLASYVQEETGSLPKSPGDDAGKTKASSTPAAPPKASNPAPSRPAEPVLPLSELFATPVSVGMLAIGAAEGNYRVFREEGTLYVEQTSLYFGHTDPGNFATNYGPCSDQGRSGGNIALAEQMCLERSRRQLPVNLGDLKAAGIDPNGDIEGLINTADLYNQASEIHSRRFPEALAMARQGGLTGSEAMAWARTASFYINRYGELDLEQGENKASGLLGICARENRPVTEWECVYHDQLRRARAIADVLENYFQVSDSSVLLTVQTSSSPAGSAQIAYQFPTQGRVRKGYSKAGRKSHLGVDIAASEGTPVVAAADGEVIAAGRGDREAVVKAAGKNWGKALVMVVAHENGDKTIYAHNQRNIAIVGQQVKRGQTIARVGKSGGVPYPHVHFELHKDGKAVNPLNYILFNEG